MSAQPSSSIPAPAPAPAPPGFVDAQKSDARKSGEIPPSGESPASGSRWDRSRFSELLSPLTSSKGAPTPPEPGTGSGNLTPGRPAAPRAYDVPTPSSAPPYPYEGDLDDAPPPPPPATQQRAAVPLVRPATPGGRRADWGTAEHSTTEPPRHALSGGTPIQGVPRVASDESGPTRPAYDPSSFPRRLSYEPPAPYETPTPFEPLKSYATPTPPTPPTPYSGFGETTARLEAPGEPNPRGLPQRVPAQPDVPKGVPEPPLVEATAETPALARIATHLRRGDVLPAQEREEGFDVQAILAAVREVEGVRDASLRQTPTGAHSLRLDLAEGADPAEVSRRVARLLQDRMGLDAAMPGEPLAGPAPAPAVPAQPTRATPLAPPPLAQSPLAQPPLAPSSLAPSPLAQSPLAPAPLAEAPASPAAPISPPPLTPRARSAEPASTSTPAVAVPPAASVDRFAPSRERVEERVNREAAERESRERETRDREAQERETREREALQRETRERESRERESRERETRQRETQEREARERRSRELEARERESREREARDLRAARELEARLRQANEREAREEEARVREVKERESREREARDRHAAAARLVPEVEEATEVVPTGVECGQPRPLYPGEHPGPRIVIENVHVNTFGSDATVEVRLAVGTRTASGVASGPAVDGYLLRLCAMATAGAVDELLADSEHPDGPARCFVEHAAAVPFGASQVAVVVLLLSCGGWVEQLAGSAVVTSDDRHAMVRATLAAVNRRLEALLSR
ncbi:Daple [Paractinoplanes maris]|uniref:Daple n=1 Tax=Paractinoplanes maris TaxID=1734446 RepID=UPI0020221F30|nr:Daple [Actinoplanes maris]